jgi:pimeloyl-ACP methyl ester carboxylesterase
MQTIQSDDDTTIAVDRSGSGPALVLVVGAFCDRFTTKALAGVLGSSFTVHEYDRRGRGSSTDAATYAIEREVADLAAVVELAEGPAFVYGHSSGAALALEAAAAGVPISKLAVYEPPYIPGPPRSPNVIDEIRGLLAEDRRADAAELFLTLTGAPQPVINMIKVGPYWAAMQKIAHTLPYDLTLSAHGSATSDWMTKIGIPVLAMAGGASAPWAPAAAATIARAVPSASELVLPGQDHNPDDELVAAALREFFLV